MSRPKTEVTTPANLVFALGEEKRTKTTLQEISDATGISTAALSNYRRAIGEPTTANIAKLADYFRVETEFLTGSGLYKNLSGSNRLDVARRFHRDAKAKEIFMQFVTERMQQIASGDTRANKAFVDYSTRMAQLRIEQQAERENLFKPLDEAFLQIPAELRKEALLRLAEQIR